MIPKSITPLYSHDLNQPLVPNVAPVGPTPPPSIPTDHVLCLISWHPQLILVPGVLQLWETSFFPHHVAPLDFPRALSPTKSFLGGCPSMGNLFFLLITWFSFLVRATVRKLDLSQLCFSLNFYFLMFLSQFPSMFPLLTYSQSFFSLSAYHRRHSRRRRSKILILLIQETV